MSQVIIEEQIGGVILHLYGQFLGGDETDFLKDQLLLVSEQKKSCLIVNLENVTYLNSTALGVLITAHANFAKRDARVILCNVGSTIQNIFVITKLTLVFTITESLEEAIKLLSV